MPSQRSTSVKLGVINAWALCSEALGPRYRPIEDLKDSGGCEVGDADRDRAANGVVLGHGQGVI